MTRAPIPTYTHWLLQQSPERRAASLSVMQVCLEYGELQRTAPRSDEAGNLRLQIQAYYARWPE